MAALTYEEMPPHPGLQPEVRCLWRAVVPALGPALPPWARVLPDGCIDIVVDYLIAADGGLQGEASLSLVGMMTRPVPFAAGMTTEVLGLRFNPGGVSAFFRIPAWELTDQAVPLVEFWGRDAVELGGRLIECSSSRERLCWIESLLLRRKQAASAGAQCALIVARQIAAKSGQVRMAELAARSGFSRQHLARLFEEHVGVAPKVLARIERFSTIVAKARQDSRGGWALTAAEHGYYDQAHFINEFSEFAGVTPTAFFGK